MAHYFLAQQKFLKNVLWKPYIQMHLYLLSMEKVPFIDTPAQENLLNIIKYFQKNDGILLVSETS